MHLAIYVGKLILSICYQGKNMKWLLISLTIGSCLSGICSQTELPTSRVRQFQSRVVLFPFREAVIASRMDGVLEKHHFKPGEKFQADVILAELDSRRFAIELKRATEQYEFAKKAFNDQKNLYEKNFTSDFEYRKAEHEFNNSKNLLDEANLNLSFCTIKAPFAGRIEEIFTREHETVRGGQPLFKVIDDNQLLAVINIPMSKLSKYKLDSPVKISLPDNKLNAEGKVYEVMPRADHRSGTIQIKALIDNQDGKYTAGMTGVLEP